MHWVSPQQSMLGEAPLEPGQSRRFLARFADFCRIVNFIISLSLGFGISDEGLI